MQYEQRKAERVGKIRDSVALPWGPETMGGKNEIMYHDVTSFLVLSVIKFYLSESASFLIHNLLVAWHSQQSGLSGTYVRGSCCLPSFFHDLWLPQALVRFYLGPQNPVCTDLLVFPKLMGCLLSLCPLPDPVNLASYFLPWGPSLFPFSRRASGKFSWRL